MFNGNFSFFIDRNGIHFRLILIWFIVILLLLLSFKLLYIASKNGYLLSEFDCRCDDKGLTLPQKEKKEIENIFKLNTRSMEINPNKLIRSAKELQEESIERDEEEEKEEEKDNIAQIDIKE